MSFPHCHSSPPGWSEQEVVCCCTVDWQRFLSVRMHMRLKDTLWTKLTACLGVVSWKHRPFGLCLEGTGSGPILWGDLASDWSREWMTTEVSGVWWTRTCTEEKGGRCYWNRTLWTPGGRGMNLIPSDEWCPPCEKGRVKNECVWASCVRPRPDCSISFGPSDFRGTEYTGCLLPRAAWAWRERWSGNWQSWPVKPGGQRQCFLELQTPPFMQVRGHTTVGRGRTILHTSVIVNSQWRNNWKTIQRRINKEIVLKQHSSIKSPL